MIVYAQYSSGCAQPQYEQTKCPNGEYTTEVIQDETCSATATQKCVINGNTIYDNTDYPDYIPKTENILDSPMPSSMSMSISKNPKCYGKPFNYKESLDKSILNCVNKKLKVDISQNENCETVNNSVCDDPTNNSPMEQSNFTSHVYNFKSKKERKIENFSQNLKCKARY